MQQTVLAWRIPWQRLLSLYGSHDLHLAQEVATKPFPDGYGPMREDDPCFVAMRAILEGGPFNKRDPSLYVLALSQLFRRIAYALDDLILLPGDNTLLARTDQLLSRRGVAEPIRLSTLTRRGPPIPIPPFPQRSRAQIGYFTPQEATLARSCLDRLILKGLPFEVREVIDLTGMWVQEAAIAKQALVCVIS